VGAPVVEAAHCGRLDSRDQLSAFRYRCALGNGAKICAADGTVLAARGHDEGPGFVIADIEPGAVEPLDELPDRFWIQPIGAIWTGSWHLQRCSAGVGTLGTGGPPLRDAARPTPASLLRKAGTLATRTDTPTSDDSR
jgi:hypothetical protein